MKKKGSSFFFLLSSVLSIFLLFLSPNLIKSDLVLYFFLGSVPFYKNQFYYTYTDQFFTFRLYAVGGRDGSSCLRSVECFDPHTNKWTNCSPMSKRRGGVGVGVCSGYLYAIGGHDAPASNHASKLSETVERSVNCLVRL